MSEAILQNIPVRKTRLCEHLLRKVNKQSPEYEGVKASIKAKGVLQPISAQQLVDNEGNTYYEVIDGAHRTEICRDLGIDTIPAILSTKSRKEVIEEQIIGNVQKIETKPYEYSKALLELLKEDWTLTQAILASMLGKTEQWVRERMHLGTLRPEIGQLVDEGKINLSNAYALAKLDPEEQPAWLERAQTTPAPEFVPAADARKKQMDKDKRAGRNTAPATFEGKPFMRKQGEILSEISDLSALAKAFSANPPASAQDAAVEALKWVMNIDAATLAVREQKWKEEVEQKAKEAAAAKEQRDAKKKAEAKERSDRIQLQTDALRDGKSESEIQAILDEYDAKLLAAKAAAEVATTDA